MSRAEYSPKCEYCKKIFECEKDCKETEYVRREKYCDTCIYDGTGIVTCISCKELKNAECSMWTARKE